MDEQEPATKRPGGIVFLEGTACAKVLGQECACRVGGTLQRPMWLKQSEQEGERKEVRAGSCRALWATRGLGLLLGGRWEP